MYESLYRFLLKYKKLNLPGIGTIVLHTKPAESEFVNQQFIPAKYYFTLSDTGEDPSPKLFPWLASHFEISESEAVIRFNDFTLGLNRRLTEGKEVNWPGVGSFQKEVSGDVAFHGDNNELSWLETVSAGKVIRENAEHTILVGEREKTSTQMTEMLSGLLTPGKKGSRWWVWPLAAILASLLFLGWYFSEHGISTASTGNHEKVSPANAP